MRHAHLEQHNTDPAAPVIALGYRCEGDTVAAGSEAFALGRLNAGKDLGQVGRLGVEFTLGSVSRCPVGYG
jgi:hypothetical protein